MTLKKSYSFNECWNEVNIHDKDNTKELMLLKEHIVNKTLDEFGYKNWLKQVIHFLLNYDNIGAYRPNYLREEFYDNLKELYPYNGTVYHGYTSRMSPSMVIKNFKSIISYSKDIKIGYEFATGCANEGLHNVLIATNIKDGFDFNEFLEDIKDYIMKEDKVYLREKEVWGFKPHNLPHIVDCKKYSLEFIRENILSDYQ